MPRALSKRITRRRIQIALGLLWLLDGALQLQRQMFTASFANNVIAPAAQGQPAIVSGPIHFCVHLILLHPMLCDDLFALIQLAIGICILYKPTARPGLIASIIWGLLVWYIGEGLGGILGGHTLLLMGAPGAALLYAIIALGVLPHRSSARPASWLVLVWAVVWLGGAALQLVNGQNTTADIAAMISGMAEGAPGWLAAFDLHVSHMLQGQGNWVIGFLVIVQAAIGFFVVLSRRWQITAVTCGIILSLLFWVVGQSLGGYYSGLATDPNTAPLIILLGIAILGAKEPEALGVFG